MFPNPNCYRLRQLSKDFTRVVADMSRDKFASLSQRLKAYVDDVSFDSHPSANGLLDTLISAKTHGYELPKEIDDQLLRDLEDLVVNEWFYGAMQSNEVRRLGLGRLAGEIKDRMVRRANGTDKQIGEDNYKLAIYSGHDTTIAPLLIILGGFDKR
ncbi:histidine phosphatase superfamily [Radiomyces spectabilis]|uniref:histidine phosphatase superfamily n=1 Tax=Radiomyces spectabilis TaxID=64574 RepID=UPI0022206F63|nr:histidine phosphatase superfamily [Radiomyces spectabilis]KAI8388547.1 histidine phosphatase superfamily [Radiomyces spectabilis]